jgi:hypothetical protein
VPHGILQVCIIKLYENVFQNPELFPTQVSLYPEKSTLVGAASTFSLLTQCGRRALGNKKGLDLPLASISKAEAAFYSSQKILTFTLNRCGLIANATVEAAAWQLHPL